MTAVRELRRLRYLAAMGEPVFVCRRHLPGARRPRRYTLAADARIVSGSDEPALVPSTELPGELPAELPGELPGIVPSIGPASPRSTAPPIQPAYRQPAKPLEDATSPGAARSVANAPAAQEPTQAGVAASPAERFRLAALVYAGRLWIEDLGDDALASEQVQLVAAIGIALEHAALPAGDPMLTQFDWPMHNNPQLGSGVEEARHTLQGFLQRMLRDHECTELLALGAAAAARVAALDLGCPTRQLPSTRDMLGNAAEKQRAWLLLRP